LSPVFVTLMDFFPSTENAITSRVILEPLDFAYAPTGNRHPESTKSDKARSASISSLESESSIFLTL
jgi:hypothetical protein